MLEILNFYDNYPSNFRSKWFNILIDQPPIKEENEKTKDNISIRDYIMDDQTIELSMIGKSPLIIFTDTTSMQNSTVHRPNKFMSDLGKMN